MNGHIMNYIQSFKPNGLANSNGTIKFSDDGQGGNLFYYSFKDAKWSRCSENTIHLDENGASNYLWKYDKNAAVVVTDSLGTELFNYYVTSDWDDDSFSAELDSFNIELKKFLESVAVTQVRASKDNLDLFSTKIRNYIMVLNDTMDTVEVTVKNIESTKKGTWLGPQLMIVGYIDAEGRYIEI